MMSVSRKLIHYWVILYPYITEKVLEIYFSAIWRHLGVWVPTMGTS